MSATCRSPYEHGKDLGRPPKLQLFNPQAKRFQHEDQSRGQPPVLRRIAVQGQSISKPNAPRSKYQAQHNSSHRAASLRPKIVGECAPPCCVPRLCCTVHVLSSKKWKSSVDEDRIVSSSLALSAVTAFHRSSTKSQTAASFKESNAKEMSSLRKTFESPNQAASCAQVFAMNKTSATPRRRELPKCATSLCEPVRDPFRQKFDSGPGCGQHVFCLLYGWGGGASFDIATPLRTVSTPVLRHSSGSL